MSTVATPSKPPRGKEASADGHGHFAVRKGVRCAGVHLIIDLHGGTGLDDMELMESTMRRCVDASGATLLHIHLHRFEPNGISGVAVLAESHISVHTWPELGYAAFDAFMCGNANPDACVEILRDAFKAKRVDVDEILRGRDTRNGASTTDPSRCLGGR